MTRETGQGTTPGRQHYVRYDMTTGKREVDIQPVLGGKTIHLQGRAGVRKSSDWDSAVLRTVRMTRGACVAPQERDDSASKHAHPNLCFHINTLPPASS